MESIFEDPSKEPLASRLRAQTLAEFVGQKHLLGDGKILDRALKAKKISSLVLWGPPGSGKTTFGLLVAKELNAEFEYLNAAFCSVADVKKVIVKARERRKALGRQTALFIDELHRFNKLQQETLVPDTENGNVILIGATIHAPTYYLIPSLISRSIVAGFKPLEKEDIVTLLQRALGDKEKGLGAYKVKIDTQALEHIAVMSAGDARHALNALEVAVLSTPAKSGAVAIDLETVRSVVKKNTVYDRGDEYHYDTISAFIKSMRGSSPDSALYWLAKMLKGGEDPRFIARRMVIFASEDIGNANPFALVLATSCFQAVEFVGMPEAQLILAHGVTYLATSLKSNKAYEALSAAQVDLEHEASQEVPDHIKTHAKDYKYPPSYGGNVEQDYGAKKQYYFPSDIGDEKRIKEFLENLRKKEH
jgi:putative ATPase